MLSPWVETSHGGLQAMVAVSRRCQGLCSMTRLLSSPDKILKLEHKHTPCLIGVVGNPRENRVRGEACSEPLRGVGAPWWPRGRQTHRSRDT